MLVPFRQIETIIAGDITWHVPPTPTLFVVVANPLDGTVICDGIVGGSAGTTAFTL